MKYKTSLIALVVSIALLISVSGVLAQASGQQISASLGTAFTYQGQLKNASGPVTDTCDFQFGLWDAVTSGTLIATDLNRANVSVTNGLFTTPIDFGVNAFEGNARWLEIAVRCPAGSGSFTTLTPRQPLTPAPYALYAATSGNTTALQGRSVTTTTPTAGQVLKWNGAQWSPADDNVGSGGNFWSLTGNAGTNPVSNFLGTRDNVALTLGVSGTAALRLQPNSTSPNVIGGHWTNAINSGVVGATIGGGGSSSWSNSVQGNYGTVSGGHSNQAGAGAAVGGGVWNRASGSESTVGGGLNNSASGTLNTIGGGENNRVSGYAGTVAGGSYVTVTGSYAAISGGRYNLASGPYATVGGGSNNRADEESAVIAGGRTNNATGIFSVIAGGELNTVSHSYTSVGGGLVNTAGGDTSTVGGGYHNTAGGPYTFVGGGYWNSASITNSTVSGGYSNLASGESSFVGGGQSNEASGPYAVIGGGNDNTASAAAATTNGGANNLADATYATVGGGHYNEALGIYTVVGGGQTNTASGGYAVIGGGFDNSATVNYATVGGGYMNSASGTGATVPGGSYNQARFSGSFAAGSHAVAAHQGAFVWADNSSSNNYISQRDNQFKIRADGGVLMDINSGGWINFYSGTRLIDTSTGAHLTIGGAWTNSSDRNLKENFTPVDGRAILAKVAQLPLSQWNYKAENNSAQHLGPMAQDWYTAFSLGSDATHISTVDADGVALAAIQGLYAEVQDRDIRISALEKQNADLQTRLDRLEKVAGKDQAPTAMNWVPWLMGMLLGLYGMVIAARCRVRSHTAE
ncbi:hypothetical protein TFLX_03848 [Thermoflexales bacterium]|nr:hypothetical protein TFLX_03848 [Thermoflexales bacterium]